MVNVKLGKPINTTFCFISVTNTTAQMGTGYTGKATKHVKIRFLFTRDLVEKGRIKVVYCHTLEMLADLLTKVLSGPQFEILRFQLGVRELD